MKSKKVIPITRRWWPRMLVFGFGMFLVAGFLFFGAHAAREQSARVSAATGSIAGTVKLLGLPPAPQLINMSFDPICASAHKKPVYTQEVKLGPNGALENVVVFLSSGLRNTAFVPPSRPAVLDQRGCMFEPHVLAVMVGQKLEILNSDKTPHGIHVLARNNEQWNQFQPVDAPPIVAAFSHPEVAVPVICSWHPLHFWMKAYVAVLSNPHFQVTGRDGSFALEGLRRGTYTIEAWHEKYGILKRQVTVRPGQTTTLDFVFKAD
jgi:plastocyanin